MTHTGIILLLILSAMAGLFIVGCTTYECRESDPPCPPPQECIGKTDCYWQCTEDGTIVIQKDTK